MKKQMKAVIAALMIISVYSTMVYAENPENMSIRLLIQEICDQVFLNGEGITRIESKVEDISDPVDYSGQLLEIQSNINEVETALANHEDNIELRLDTLEAQLTGIPVMTSQHDYYTATLEPGTHTIFDVGYPNPANIHINLSGGIIGEDAAIIVKYSISSADNTVWGTKSLGGITTDAGTSPFISEFTAQRIVVIAYAPNGAQVSTFYSVTAIYLP